jgi:FKBP-type peptidyl-prolyl cis-trans isomerase FklB
MAEMVFVAEEPLREIQMKLQAAAVLSLSAVLGLIADEPPVELKTQKDKISYSIGMNWGNMLKRETVDIDLAILTRAMKDALAGAKPALTDQQVKEVMTAFQTEMSAKQNEKRKEAGNKNKLEGEAFLAENKKKEGVITLPSGLQYKVITAGTGKKPTLKDKVLCHYRGTFVDGKEFDSSYTRGEPIAFALTGVIAGWTEALQLMPVGSKWKLFIPSDKAYGEFGKGDIGPNTALLFDIELISIEEAAAEPKK